LECWTIFLAMILWQGFCFVFFLRKNTFFSCKIEMRSFCKMNFWIKFGTFRYFWLIWTGATTPVQLLPENGCINSKYKISKPKNLTKNNNLKQKIFTRILPYTHIFYTFFLQTFTNLSNPTPLYKIKF
jgi:hypothetical protein